MIGFDYECQLAAKPLLRHGMYSDRRRQFGDRLNWPVLVDHNGWERDEYDRLNPLYLSLSDARGTHQGSLRFLPTCGPNMLQDHFAYLVGGARLSDPRVWEVTRFCLSPRATGLQAAAAILLAANELGLALSLKGAVGVFNLPMLRVYRRIGWKPRQLGHDRPTGYTAGMWEFASNVTAQLAARYELDAFGTRRTVHRFLNECDTASGLAA